VSAPARVSAGSGASSGQFAPTQHAEPDIALDDELDDESCSHCGEDAAGGDGYDLDLNRSVHHSTSTVATRAEAPP